MINKYIPHILVLPEDDADRNLALGFLRHSTIDDANVHLLTSARGWVRVVDEFVNVHALELTKYPLRYIVLVIDFDEDSKRYAIVSDRIPDELRDRVFVLGAWSNPENLHKAQKMSLNSIGTVLAEECVSGSMRLWNCEELKHNDAELRRIGDSLRPVLRPSS